MLRQKPEEVLGMFSEALKILDQNTVKYMIEELQKELEEKDAVIAATAKEKEAAIAAASKEKEAAIAAAAKEKEAAIAAVKERDAELDALRKQLEHYRKSQ